MAELVRELDRTRRPESHLLAVLRQQPERRKRRVRERELGTRRQLLEERRGAVRRLRCIEREATIELHHERPAQRGSVPQGVAEEAVALDRTLRRDERVVFLRRQVALNGVAVQELDPSADRLVVRESQCSRELRGSLPMRAESCRARPPPGRTRGRLAHRGHVRRGARFGRDRAHLSAAPSAPRALVGAAACGVWARATARRRRGQARPSNFTPAGASVSIPEARHSSSASVSPSVSRSRSQTSTSWGTTTTASRTVLAAREACRARDDCVPDRLRDPGAGGRQHLRREEGVSARRTIELRRIDVVRRRKVGDRLERERLHGDTHDCVLRRKLPEHDAQRVCGRVQLVVAQEVAMTSVDDLWIRLPRRPRTSSVASSAPWTSSTTRMVGRVASSSISATETS